VSFAVYDGMETFAVETCIALMKIVAVIPHKPLE
jgi:hypothetical protein